MVPSQSAGSEEDLIPLYISSSKNSPAVLKLGIGTKDPLTNVDIRADEFQIQRVKEKKGLKINTEGNIESFDKTPESATTGSEFILNYSRGVEITAANIALILNSVPLVNDAAAVSFFNSQTPDLQAKIIAIGEKKGLITPPNTGDTLGAMRWVAQSGSSLAFNPRGTGETAVIKAVVSDVNATGVQADLIFSVAGKEGAATQRFLIDAGNEHQITGSLNVLGSIRTSGFIQPRGSENSQTRIDFSNSGVDIDFYSNTSQVLKLSNTGVVFNESSNDIDFRIEGNNNANLFFIDAGNDRVGIGTNIPDEKLTVDGNIKASGAVIAQSYIVSESIIVHSVSSGSTVFGDSADDSHNFIGSITSSGVISASGNIIALSSDIITINGGSF